MSTSKEKALGKALQDKQDKNMNSFVLTFRLRSIFFLDVKMGHSFYFKLEKRYHKIEKRCDMSCM